MPKRSFQHGCVCVCIYMCGGGGGEGGCPVEGIRNTR